MANANFFSPDGGITRYPLEDTEGRIMYEDGIDGINLVNCDSPDVYMNATKSGTADNFTVSSTSAGTYRGIGWHIPVKPNTSYTISADVVVSSGSGYFAVRTGDNKSQITALNIPTSSDGVVLRFNSGSETMVRAYVYCTAGTSESGSVTYKDYKITETRFEEVPYRPYNQQSIQHQLNAQTGVLGAKNLLENIATTQTVNGVTYTVNTDGTVTANGTATGQANLEVNSSVGLGYGDYILTGCPVGGSPTSYGLAAHSGTSWIDEERGSGLKISNTIGKIVIVIRGGYTANNLTFKPMIRLASDPSDEYVPYAMTNRELTEKIGNGVDYYVDSTTGIRFTKWGSIAMINFSNTGSFSFTAADGAKLIDIPTRFLPHNNNAFREELNSKRLILKNTTSEKGLYANEALTNAILRGSFTYITAD